MNPSKGKTWLFQSTRDTCLKSRLTLIYRRGLLSKAEMFLIKAVLTIQNKLWPPLDLMQFTFLSLMTLSIPHQEDTEREQCQILIQQTTPSTNQVKLLSEPVISTHTDIQVRFSEQETPTRNSRVKKILTALKWSLIRLISLDKSKLSSIIVLDTS